MSQENINDAGQLLKFNGKSKLLQELKNEFSLQGQSQFIYDQIIYSIPKSWKDSLLPSSENIKNLSFQGLHVIKKYQIYYLSKLNSKEIYSILIESGDSKSSQLYYNFFLKIQILMGKLYMCYLI